MRTCVRCLNPKPEDAFYRRSSGLLRTACKACHIASNREHQQRNRAHRRAYLAAYHEAHRPASRKRRERRNDGKRTCTKCAAVQPLTAFASRGNHRGPRGDCRACMREAHQAWCRANPEKVFLGGQRRRRALREAPGRCTAQQLRARIAYYGERCAYCRGPFECVDHVVAIARGGSNWPANLRPACVACNSSKKAKPLREWQR